jgi:hypothetical protein
MELAKGIIIPVLADFVLSPDVYYGDNHTGIYFQTEDDQFGRITFNNLDAIKICRGENLPFADDWKVRPEVTWVYKVENSKWLKERFSYENENYGSSYEFGRNVNEMLTDFSHYVFKFHDQFVEVIARGFWFEKDASNLFKKDLKEGHPFLPLPEINIKTFEIEGIKYKAIFNPLNTESLIQDTKYCPQKLIEFAVEFEGKYSVSQTLIIMQRQDRLISVLSQFIGQPQFETEGVAAFEEIKPIVDRYIGEVAERRRQMR